MFGSYSLLIFWHVFYTSHIVVAKRKSNLVTMWLFCFCI